MAGQRERVFFGVVTNIQHHNTREFIGFEVALDDERSFRFPCIFQERNEFKVGRRIFMDFSAWPQRESGITFIHVFKSDDEMEKECDGTIDGTDICYIRSYMLLKEFIPWAT